MGERISGEIGFVRNKILENIINFNIFNFK